MSHTEKARDRERQHLEACDRAVIAGAAPLAARHDAPWGQTGSYARDHVGTLIGTATPIGG